MGSLATFDLESHVRHSGCRTFVETGTGRGEGLAYAAAAGFRNLYSVELVPDLVAHGLKRFGHNPAIALFQGTSEDFLPSLLPRLASDEPILFWLDAHSPQDGISDRRNHGQTGAAIGLPLARELALIRTFRPDSADVILINALHLYENGPPQSLGIPAHQFAYTHQIRRFDHDRGYLVMVAKSARGRNLLSMAGRQAVERQISAATQAGRLDTAQVLIGQLLDEPELPGNTLANLTELARRAGNLEAALQAGRRAVAAAPGSAAVFNNLGLVLLDRGDAGAARGCFETALHIDGGYVRAYHNLAKLWIDMGRLAEAERALRRALALKADNPLAWTSLGSIARRRYDTGTASAFFERALRLDPHHLRARLNQAAVLLEQGAYARVEESLNRLARDYPGQAEVWAALAALYDRLHRHDAAAAALAHTVRLRPGDAAARAAWIDSRRKCCDWSNWAQDMEWLKGTVAEALADGRVPPLPPLTSVRYPTTAAEQLAIAQAHARRIQAQVAGIPAPRVAPAPGPRLRIGLLTHEFRQNVVGHFLRHLPAAFDRRRFEVYGFVYNPDDGSATRRDLMAGCDHIEDVTKSSVTEAAHSIARHGVHILIDINSYMQDGRPEIAALRPAPVQISYLYPGTMGAPWIDYLLTDEIVSPPDHAEHYQERLLYLPPCYLPATGQVAIADNCPGRAYYGLPQRGFVFCSFNKEDKVDPETFAVWMDILQAVPGSVLWLAANMGARPHLRRAAAERGTDPARLVFADHEPDMTVHLARHRHADLFLDSFLHSAHVTGADALWAGLPMLTRLGTTYAGRVAASLLTAAGLPALIAGTSDDYRQRAIALAREPQTLAALRQSWQARRAEHPLFRADVKAAHLGEVLEGLVCRKSHRNPDSR